MRQTTIMLYIFVLNFLLLPAAPAESKQAKLAVSDFHLSGSDFQNPDMGWIMAEMFITTLVKDERFEIIERSVLKKVLEEQTLTMSGIIDESAAAKAGKILGVDAIVTGTVIKFDNTFEVSARCIDVETASIIAAESGRTQTETGLRQLAEELATKLAKSSLPALSVRSGGPGATPGEPGGNTMKNVYGLVGSEKVSIFSDPRAQSILSKHGLIAAIDWAGSRQMANSHDIGRYDFAFPSGMHNAAKIGQSHGVHSYHVTFFTPMVIASWRPIADILAANDIVTEENGIYFISMAKLMENIKKEKQWKDLLNNSAYQAHKDILITSTDVRTSNSAAMYLALASFVENGNKIVATEQEIQKVLPLMRRLFLAQGSQATSSKEPFDDYLLMGMGKSPLVMIYESQFIEASRNSALSPDMVLLYPVPTVYVKEVVVPLTMAGEKAGEFIKNNSDFNQLAIEHGMHTRNSAKFADYTKGLGLVLPSYLVDVINPPEYDTMEKMIGLIHQE